MNKLNELEKEYTELIEQLKVAETDEKLNEVLDQMAEINKAIDEILNK